MRRSPQSALAKAILAFGISGDEACFRRDIVKALCVCKRYKKCFLLR
jgi:hypothetical protein